MTSPVKDTRTGTLYGVGLGPGDPNLMTLRAVQAIGDADVVAYHSARHGRSIARSIAAAHLRPDHIEEALVYPVTTETTDHPGGYRGALEEFYEKAAARLAAHLDAGLTVAVLAEGDPMFYGSYMHMHKRLADRYPTEVIPGVTSVSAAAARLGTPLVEGEEILTILPGTLPEEELTARLAATDTAVVMKLGRTFPAVRGAFEASGRLAEARYVERATMAGERTGELADIDPASVPYFSVAVLPSRVDAPRPSPSASPSASGDVVVVGTGPAGPLWLTPETRGALAAADDVVGYTTYLDRVPVRPGQARHGSDNKVESERAEFALDLARRGRRVAVVSGGDPGVFAMATAVLEVASQEEYADIPVQVLPGVTAANAAAARAGAPLGHDYATISLSDRLKPWEVIAERLRAAASADLVLALYNPGSMSRTWQVGKARDLLLEHRSPDTPVVLARDVGGPTESVRTVRLADVDPAEVDMRTLLIVGSSQTRWIRRGGAGADRSVVWTPRRYPEA
ncbi:precorrin-2 C(20)-methyltransferase [Streptomyces sp. ID03-2B]|uniref:precorrin-2 C(20)-methyltransferase n=1 Tax=Streptomyces sp. 43Y-GA-1 TaxID=2939435 RepID=UPI0020C04D6A|nr:MULTISPECIES: precorrin-2 C(20)-methyltransferase [unclassified Streptomyces]MCL6291321.1 precorrin-2 C(20)-methyltransferase [Streptomyces sp. 43Y-GA-1]MDX3500304.1 precorrin-2 C(20)-methyltransferase [Streptomyces sp. ATCC51928]MDX3592012.1 precorrin-2 C(20)-methyltransferase [Streptomyces sp. ID03-2B]MDX5520365.1 precorrin-2 C(20)-methyltransferase [Streptomyces sp. DE06-01C]